MPTSMFLFPESPMLFAVHSGGTTFTACGNNLLVSHGPRNIYRGPCPSMGGNNIKAADQSDPGNTTVASALDILVDRPFAEDPV